jgi:O-antigen ligase
MLMGFGSIVYMIYKHNAINKLFIGFASIIVIMIAITTFSVNQIGYGNDPLEELKTLNNRTVIYDVAFEGIKQNPWFGVGYVEGVKEFLKENFTQDFWLPPHTHNGYIEIALSLGIPFFILFSILSLRLLFVSFKNIILSNNKTKIAASMQIVVIMTTAMTTVIIGNTITSLFTLFLFYIYTSIAFKYKFQKINQEYSANYNLYPSHQGLKNEQ